MLPEVSANTDVRQPIDQEPPLAAPPPSAPPVPPARAIEARREEPPPAAPPTPPTPPGGAILARPSGRRWTLSLGVTALGALSWFFFVWGVAWGNTLIAILSAAVPAASCLVAGWLLRSWWGLVAAALVYTVVSALMWTLFMGGGPAGMAFLTFTFALYVVLPAVIMAAIGTAIGMYRAR